MQLVYFLIFFISIFSCGSDNTGSEDDKKLSGENQDGMIQKEEAYNKDDTKNYLYHYRKGDSLLSSYYTNQLLKINLKENVITAAECFRESLLYTTNSISGLKKLAECNIILKEYSQALTSLEKCLNISNDFDTYLHMANAYKGIGKNDKSINICDSIINIDTDTMHIIESSLLIADIYAQEFDTKALRYYNIVLKINPNHIKALYGKGLFYQNNQKYSEAVDVYKEIKKIDPFHLDATFNLGFISMEESHDYNNAINYFSDVIVSEKDYYPAYFARGICYEEKGMIVAAEKNYRAALKIYPNYLDAKERLEKLLSDKNE